MKKWVESIQPRIGTQGWKQFLTSKKKMLDIYDNSKVHSKSHKVPTSTGIIAESEFRKWLSEFLPKRYAVTSGYIISQGRSDKVASPHFDVIIYNRLDSPILWIEGDSEISTMENPRAIPAEYVHGVFEIKTSFNSVSTKKAIDHLLELKPLLDRTDTKENPYKRYIHKDFVCGVVFFELLKRKEYSKTALNNLVPEKEIRGYHGGIILRGEGLGDLHAGRIRYTKLTGGGSYIKKGKDSLLDPIVTSEKFLLEGDERYRANLMWNETCFSMFAFDLICQLEGTYVDGEVHSYHGLSFLSVSDDTYED